MKRRINFIIVTFIITCSIFVINKTNSRYLSEVNMDGKLDVAIPQIEIDTSNYTSSISILPGETKAFEFAVKNYTDSQINEILMEYYLNISFLKSDIPLTYKLYQISGTNENELNQTTNGFGPITLNYENQEETKYKIQFSWDESKDSILYANQEFYFEISAKTIEIYEQIITSEEMILKGREYSDLSATGEKVADTDNTFDVTVTNTNPYTVKYKVDEENGLFNVKYGDSTDATIEANTTDTVRVVFSKREDIEYENVLTDSSGNTYKTVTIVLDAISPYDADQIQISTDQIIYIEKLIKNSIVNSAIISGKLEEYDTGNAVYGTTSSSDSMLCSVEDPSSGETMYFYRGNVTDNYVSFANYTWRILRINSDGSLRLILDDIATTSQYQSSNEPEERTIASALTLINWKDSVAYSTLRTWYDSNIAAQYGDKVVESKFVFDNTYSESTSSSAAACYYFGSYLRIGTDGNTFIPSFSYTDDIVITDNVGLISGDELVYAGAYFRAQNTSFFLYNPSITTDWWTMSPSFWDSGSHYKAGMMILNTQGKLHDWPDSGDTLTSTLGLRPVITIRGDLEMTGDGTESNPYEYKE